MWFRNRPSVVRVLGSAAFCRFRLGSMRAGLPGRRLIATARQQPHARGRPRSGPAGVNRSTVTSRIDRLVDSGVIEGFTLRLSNDVDRDAIRGVTTVVTRPNNGQDVVREIRGYPEVEGLHSTTGAWDLVVQLRCHSLSEFDLVLERIRSIPGVRDTRPACSSTR